MAARTGFLLALAVCASAIWACCAVSTKGRSPHLRDQINLVIWDEKRQVEHFIRDARFGEFSREFSFIAPTPSKPELSEVDPKLFRRLERLASTGFPGAKSGSMAVRAAAGGVEVVGVQDVAGYRATILKASDAPALDRWLKANKFEMSEDLVKNWLAHYVKKGWHLTAFKLKPDGMATGTGVIRMTFPTSRPFNPYKVPRENLPRRAGHLTLWFLAAGSYKPLVGGAEEWAEPKDRRVLTPEEAREIGGLVKLKGRMPEGRLTLASYVHEFPEAGKDDLFFKKDPSPRESAWEKYRRELHHGSVDGAMAGASAAAGLAVGAGFLLLRLGKSKGRA